MTGPGLLLVGNFLSAHIGTRSMGEDLAERLAGSGHPVLTTSSKKGRAGRVLDMAATILRRRKEYEAAYVEVYSGLAFTWAEVCAGLLSAVHKPFVLALHGGGLPNFSRKNSARFRRLLSRAKAVVTPSLYLQKSLSVLYPGLRYLPNAIDLPGYPFRLRDKVQPKLIWLRAFHNIYNPEMGVRALAEISQAAPHATLTMIGPDKQDGSLPRTMRLAEQLHLSSRVRVTGAIPKSSVPSALSRGDIFINTTRLESFGVSVLEAAACGLPVVTTRAGELEYLWNDGEDALLVAVGDSRAMGEAILALTLKPELARRLSGNARSKAEQFDWKFILPGWIDLFAEVAAR